MVQCDAMLVDSHEGRAQIRTSVDLSSLINSSLDIEEFRKAGIRFDPVVVDAFLKTYRPEEGSQGLGE